MRAAFIGLGAMGTGIASNILKTGCTLSVWNKKDRCYPNLEILRKMGAVPCEDIGGAVAGAEIIGMSLTNDQAVAEVCRQLPPYISEGAVICDFSTVSPRTSKEMNAFFSEIGVFYLDTPVSGGIQGANEGSLSVMVGGDYSGFQKAEPIIRSVSSKYEYFGDSGSGAAAKLINQLLTAANQAIVCETMLLAMKSGLDMQKLYDMLVVSWGNSKMLERSVKQYIIPGQYESSACIELMDKDLKLARRMADDFGLDMPISGIVRDLFQRAAEEGLGRQDHSAIIKIMNRAKEGDERL